MSPSDPFHDITAVRVLEATLNQVRQEKLRRRHRRAAVAAGIPLVLLGGWLALMPSFRPASAFSSVRGTVPAVIQPALEDEKTLAVLVMRDGAVTFEQRPANDLADVDLTFSLDPVIAPFHN